LFGFCARLFETPSPAASLRPLPQRGEVIELSSPRNDVQISTLYLVYQTYYRDPRSLNGHLEFYFVIYRFYIVKKKYPAVLLNFKFKQIILCEYLLFNMDVIMIKNNSIHLAFSSSFFALSLLLASQGKAMDEDENVKLNVVRSAPAQAPLPGANIYGGAAAEPQQNGGAAAAIQPAAVAHYAQPNDNEGVAVIKRKDDKWFRWPGDSNYGNDTPNWEIASPGEILDNYSRGPGDLNYGQDKQNCELPDPQGREPGHVNYGFEQSDDQLPDVNGRQPGDLNYGNPLLDYQLPDVNGRQPGALNHGNPLLDYQLPDQWGREPGHQHYGIAPNLLNGGGAAAPAPQHERQVQNDNARKHNHPKSSRGGKKG
jgi:hypothetical protein